ncbi:hypothetical protein BH23ACT5_BH23ACT5_24680 [soil metagenome]
MPAVHIDSVSFSYSSAIDVLTDLSFSLGPGWSGLVGENGTGKTTPLRLVTGDLTPTAGRVLVDPSDAIIGWCPQVVDELTPDIGHFAESWDAHDAALRGRLSLDAASLEL